MAEALAVFGGAYAAAHYFPGTYIADAIIIAATAGEAGQALADIYEAYLEVQGITHESDLKPAAKKLAELIVEASESGALNIVFHLGGKAIPKGKKTDVHPASNKMPQIRVNQVAGDAASDAIASRFPGARREVTIQTSDGVRRIDVLTREGLAIESKVGRTSLTSSVKRQVLKDAEILNDPTSGVNQIIWEFSRSATTGKVGPTPSLRAFLEANGIGIRIVP